MSKILWSVVLYPSTHFDIFLKDCFEGIASQTFKNFSLFLFYDGLDQIQQEKVKQACQTLNLNPIFIHKQLLGAIHPSQIRHQIITFAIENDFEILIFSDFDEMVDSNRLELTLPALEDFDFAYCNAYITDFNYQKLHSQDLHTLLKIPNSITNVTPIIDKNFIGLGSLGINLKNYANKHLKTLPHTLAYDWFLATYMLLCNLKGKSISLSFTKYRQHSDTYIGIGRPLNPQTLHLGLQAKLNHYAYFSQYAPIFQIRLGQMIALENYLGGNKQTIEKYIKIINEHFNPLEMNWWENIKTLEEIQQWI